MTPYNGYSGQQRLRALAWANKGYANGTRQRATVCDACDQRAGVIERHSEDYSEPFGDHIGAYSFCYVCHMMVHCRFRAVAAWAAYRNEIAAGATFPPLMTRNFMAIKDSFLQLKFPRAIYRAPPTYLVLEEIDTGQSLRRAVA